MAEEQFSIRRTGNIYSIASSEFEITYPDGTIGKVWSPPWHELEPDDELEAALKYAQGLYQTGTHKPEGVTQ